MQPTRCYVKINVFEGSGIVQTILTDCPYSDPAIGKLALEIENCQAARRELGIADRFDRVNFRPSDKARTLGRQAK